PGAMEHLAERDAAEGRVDEVVQRGVVGLAEELPGGAAEGGDRGRLVEAEAVGSPGVEIVVALIRMADLIDREVIQIPHPPLLHVRPPRLWRDTAGDLAARQVPQPVDHVDAGGLENRHADAPRWTAFAGAPFVAGVDGVGALII